MKNGSWWPLLMTTLFRKFSWKAVSQRQLQRLCIKPVIQERGTECGEHREWGECYIPGNATKHSGVCCQTFRGMSSNIPGNVAKHPGVCCQTFRGMSPKISRNVLKHSGECCQTFRGTSSIFVVNKENYWAESHLESCQTSTMELFCENSQRP